MFSSLHIDPRQVWIRLGFLIVPCVTGNDHERSTGCVPRDEHDGSRAMSGNQIREERAVTIYVTGRLEWRVPV